MQKSLFQKSRVTALPPLMAFVSLVLAALNVAYAQADSPEASNQSVFAQDNLVAWCIVPFDGKKRGPAERAAGQHGAFPARAPLAGPRRGHRAAAQWQWQLR